MKRIAAILVSLIFGVLAIAKPVSEKEAEGIAAKVLGSAGLNLKWTGKSASGAGAPAFYVFTRQGGGFVVISGDDSLGSVLAYSHEFDFKPEKMPDPAAEWFKAVSESAHIAGKNRVAKSNPSPSAGSGEVLLVTALWNQMHPYNMYAPRLRANEEHCNTGCTNTATAIVMRYHRHPIAGTGTLPDYSYTKVGVRYTHPGHALGHLYDWGNMPLFPLDENTPANQAEQVAQLMYDCGVMNKCMWNPYNADTDPVNIPYGLKTYMGYDSAIQYLIRDSYSDDEWESLLRAEIDAGRPVIYSGGREDGNGHSWVVDGYSDGGFFHMNWGWGGISNGFFLISPFENYPLRNIMIIGIKPAEDSELYDGLDPYSDLSVGSLTGNWNFKTNEAFTAKCTIWNGSANPCPVKCRLALTDNNESPKLFLSSLTNVDVRGGDYSYVDFENCTIPTIPDKDDLIMVFYEDGGLWKPMPRTEDAIIRMRGPSAIEECTTFSYSKSEDRLTVTTEKDNVIEFVVPEWDWAIRSDNNSGALAVGVTDYFGSYQKCEVTVRVYNLVETKEFRVKLAFP